MMIRYCVGFAFDASRDCVLLIQKNRPAWQAGKWNGLGGKCELNENPYEAMTREFKEECGIETQEKDWNQFCVIKAKYPEPAILFCFSASLNINRAKTMESETVAQFYTTRLPYALRDNLKWLIPMAVAQDPVTATVTENK